MKTVILGLDCADPYLLFERFKPRLTTISKLMEVGGYGKLLSIDPPITVPAWMSMMTGKSPGELGIYGFRNRISQQHYGWELADSSWVREETLWDTVGRQGGSSIVIGVPLTYPPKPIKGHLISCFLTPDKQTNFTYPPELKEELLNLSPDYRFDVSSFRSEDKKSILDDIYAMTEARLKTAAALMQRKEWDLFVMVEIATDRIHHAFWQYMDESHVLYQAGSRFATAIEDYYVWLDERLNTFLDQIPDDTTLFIVSDHGAKAMEGGFRINKWLIEHGYLYMKRKPEWNQGLNYEHIDWSRTIAWGEGGYYGRLFINLKGREQEGIVEKVDYDETLLRMERQMNETQGPDHWQGVRCLRPVEIYPDVKGVAPDLLVYAGDLSWRCLGTFGENIFSLENDHGPDGANHAMEGIVVTAVKQDGQWGWNKVLPKGQLGTLDILSIRSLALQTLAMKN